MPIGELRATYGEIEKKLGKKTDDNRRDDKACKYNSPLNFVYISKNANIQISNLSLSIYQNYCDSATLTALDIDGSTMRCSDDIKELDVFLQYRYNKFKDRMTTLLRYLLDNNEIECGSDDK